MDNDECVQEAWRGYREVSEEGNAMIVSSLAGTRLDDGEIQVRVSFVSQPRFLY